MFNTSDANLISSELVAEDLGLEVHPLDGAGDSAVEIFNGQEVGVKGYVELVWRLQNNQKKHFCTRFVVTAEDNPPFDAVLGRKAAREYGL